MPIYEFACEQCGKEFERLVFGSVTEAVTCPACGSDRTRKQFSVFSSAGTDKALASSCGSRAPGRFS